MDADCEIVPPPLPSACDDETWKKWRKSVLTPQPKKKEKHKEPKPEPETTTAAPHYSEDEDDDV
jgi:hypothetical protein